VDGIWSQCKYAPVGCLLRIKYLFIVSCISTNSMRRKVKEERGRNERDNGRKSTHAANEWSCREAAFLLATLLDLRRA